MVTAFWYMACLCFLATYWTRRYRGSSNMCQKHRLAMFQKAVAMFYLHNLLHTDVPLQPPSSPPPCYPPISQCTAVYPAPHRSSTAAPCSPPPCSPFPCRSPCYPPISQCTPVYPTPHRQLNELIPSTHTPEWRHGLVGEQSFMSERIKRKYMYSILVQLSGQQIWNGQGQKCTRAIIKSWTCLFLIDILN